MASENGNYVPYGACRMQMESKGETVARLRNVTVRTDNSNVIAELQRMLKVAEDALAKLQTICQETEYIYWRVICENALAAIREEGEKK